MSKTVKEILVEYVKQLDEHDFHPCIEVSEVVADYLDDNGFSGLVNTDECCGCEIDDLMSICSPSVNCKAGYKEDCFYEDGDMERCSGCSQPDQSFHICLEKPVGYKEKPKGGIR